MEVEEVKNHKLHSASDAFFVEDKSGGIVAVFHTLKILKAQCELRFIEFHHGVHEQRELSLHAVV